MEAIRVHDVYPGIPNLRIPDSVLRYPDPRAPGVSACKASLGLGVARTNRPEPVRPTQRVLPGRRGGPQTRFGGSRGSQGSFGRGTVGEQTGRIVEAFGSTYSGSDVAGPVMDRGHRVLHIVLRHYRRLLHLPSDDHQLLSGLLKVPHKNHPTAFQMVTRPLVQLTLKLNQRFLVPHHTGWDMMSAPTVLHIFRVRAVRRPPRVIRKRP